MSDDPISPLLRPEDFPFADWQLTVENTAERLSGRVRQSARSAFVHLRKAWRLHGIDDEMSAFRAITAEEEAATALIMALKQRRYQGADRLRPWNHVHKNAFWPLVVAVNQFLFRSGMPTPRVALSKRGAPRVTLHIDLNALMGRGGDPKWAEPDQPLNFAIRSGHASTAAVHLFREELAELANQAGDNSIEKYVRRQANTRNELLYASDEGVPSVAFADSMLIERARRVSILVILATIVMQTPNHQLFVTQCLEALLRGLASVSDLEFDYSHADDIRGRPLLTIERHEDAAPRMSIRRPVQVGLTWSYPGAPDWFRSVGQTWRVSYNHDQK